MENKTFERREDIPLQHRWATEDLYASDEGWEQELQHMIARAGRWQATPESSAGMPRPCSPI